MNTSNNTQPPVQVNPIECARNALNFLSRVSFTRAERLAFDHCEGMLSAIAEGQVILSSAQPQEPLPIPAALPNDPPEKKRARKPRRANGHVSNADVSKDVKQDSLI